MQVDFALVVAVERKCTGANCHKARNLLQVYEDHCTLDDLKAVEQDKRELYKLLRKAA